MSNFPGTFPETSPITSAELSPSVMSHMSHLCPVCPLYVSFPCPTETAGLAGFWHVFARGIVIVQ
jgi:hypothetical protein